MASIRKLRGRWQAQVRRRGMKPRCSHSTPSSMPVSGLAISAFSDQERLQQETGWASPASNVGLERADVRRGMPAIRMIEQIVNHSVEDRKVQPN